MAEVGDVVAGLLVARLQVPVQNPEHELVGDLSRARVFVQVLGVAEPHRRGGVGTALMASAEPWLTSRDQASLHALESRAARAHQ